MRSNPGRPVVLITGASSGLGRALAEEFARRRHVVVASARNLSELQSLQREIESRGGTCHVVRMDVRKEGDVRSGVRTALRKAKRVDILVNNAGVTSFKHFLDTPTVEFDQIVETNLRGMFLVTRSILPQMIRKRSGVLLNILSYAAKTTYAGSSAYSASKAAGGAMMKVIREELREENIKVINVYPGAVLTPMWKRIHRTKYAHRMIAPEEMARLICDAALQPSSMMVEELVVRPQRGDLKV